MSEITITITIPEGATINIAEVEAVVAAPVGPTFGEAADWIARYWNYLSENGRKVFAQAARHEKRFGPGYTLEDLADALSIDYESIKSYHRSAGRSAKRWRREEGIPEPIGLVSMDYSWSPSAQGFRTSYRLPDGVADRIPELEQADHD